MWVILALSLFRVKPEVFWGDVFEVKSVISGRIAGMICFNFGSLIFAFKMVLSGESTWRERDHSASDLSIEGICLI